MGQVLRIKPIGETGGNSIDFYIGLRVNCWLSRGSSRGLCFSTEINLSLTPDEVVVAAEVEGEEVAAAKSNIAEWSAAVRRRFELLFLLLLF